MFTSIKAYFSFGVGLSLVCQPLIQLFPISSKRKSKHTAYNFQPFC